MNNQITQDWDRLKVAVRDLRQFLTDVEPSRLPLGAVVKTEKGLIGVITGMEAPPMLMDEWEYLVCIPDTDHADYSEETWYERNQLEVLQWESDRP